MYTFFKIKFHKQLGYSNQTFITFRTVLVHIAMFMRITVTCVHISIHVYVVSQTKGIATDGMYTFWFSISAVTSVLGKTITYNLFQNTNIATL